MKATLWNPFIVHCQHALIKNASTFADSSVNCVQLFFHCLLPCLGPKTTTIPRRGGETSANWQFAVYRRGGRVSVVRYWRNTENWFVWSNNVCPNSLQLQRPTHIHTFICSACVCVCVCLQKLCNSVISKRNYEFASRTSVSYFVIFVAEPFVNNFCGRLVDCQVVSDTHQLKANIPINQTSVASILHVRGHLDELWIVQLFRAYFQCSKVNSYVRRWSDMFLACLRSLSELCILLRHHLVCSPQTFNHIGIIVIVDNRLTKSTMDIHDGQTVISY